LFLTAVSNWQLAISTEPEIAKNHRNCPKNPNSTFVGIMGFQFGLFGNFGISGDRCSLNSYSVRSEC
jgi:hypothetical protein